MMRELPQQKQEPSECWDSPIKGEIPKAFRAFCVYRNLGSDRSIKAAYLEYLRRERQNSGKTTVSKNVKKPPRHGEEWAAKNYWTSRARAYDTYVERRELNELVRERIQWRRRIRRRRMERSDQIDAIATKALKAFDGEEVNLATQPSRWTVTSPTRSSKITV